MFILLLYWFVLFLFASLSGIAFKNTIGLTQKNTSFTLLFGIIFQTLLLSICAFFYRINLEVFILNCVLQLVFYLKYKTEFKSFFYSLFKSFSKKQLYLFCFFCLLIAFKSAQLPTIFDNESYYIQTIKWLNEYGYLKGLANVHPFLAQSNFWHVLQSGFNFTFISPIINDVNGFLLLIGIYYFFDKYTKNPGLYLVINVLFLFFYFQFLDAPSPDLPILIFSCIIFYEFIFNNLNTKKRKSLLLFLIYICFIKLTIFPLLLLVFYILKKEKKSFIYFISTSLIFGIVWILKNIIITGLPFFPLHVFALDLDWKMIPKISEMISQVTIDAGYSENLTYTKNLNLFEKLNLWIHLGGLNAIFNFGILFLFIAVLFSSFFKIYKFKILYFILLIHFIFLLVTSPQYRFFLPTFILFSGIIIFDITAKIRPLKNTKLLISVSILSLILSILIDIKSFQFNKIHIRQIVIPDSNTKYNDIVFEQKKVGNFIYNDPKLSNFFETSNGDLPCVNEKMLKYYKYLPQQRTINMKDGFYAKETENE